MKKVKQKEVFVADRGVHVAHVALAMMKTKMKNHDIPQGGNHLRRQEKLRPKKLRPRKQPPQKRQLAKTKPPNGKLCLRRVTF